MEMSSYSAQKKSVAMKELKKIAGVALNNIPSIIQYSCWLFCNASFN
jgi:hypothetical protein